MTPIGERRGRQRLPLRCSLLLYRRGMDQPIRGETLNISSEGFYLLVDALFSPGETLSCTLNVPSEAARGSEGMKLKYDVKVVRVDSVGHRFGVACKVHTFNVIPRASSVA